jgi:hypothetical protein
VTALYSSGSVKTTTTMQRTATTKQGQRIVMIRKMTPTQGMPAMSEFLQKHAFLSVQVVF